ncbi:hypothetical protein F441_15601 [Phytophthora nicotianae CJ01A1]|uniref:CCHC-type domain-containing protein n=6 Tax=Phytophthora nicotianae TaxID=4792 RepID=W2R2D2_PHYN3|nr:hypothetical protein PPTG_21469 [Phytophthora nicotianae INRA-310]ETI38513.1 hypothetical protein F443_15777 [Phytophthora nicotianae P1569]ETK78721.1 hypothetical protein L915_15324 [Phytophthora nicotianae]ETO67283.1 hypothetical protein F444_15756 [Phytophthora nicotianae P1976]ETP08414.1 hypothetical protein F441_15601 [Phytophthora nicotianae CJ01A1]ETP36461.1 hypothetical protein F442_15612 [Phytophthora nicotianae P10297]
MEVDHVNVQDVSREECRKRRLCFRCKRAGHRMSDCRVKLPHRKNERLHKSNTRSINAVQINQPTVADVQGGEPLSFRNYS